MNMNKILMNMPRRQKLMTKEILAKIPKLYETEGQPLNKKKAFVKFFTPANQWTWYGMEYDPEDKMFFGYVHGFEREFGYFSLTELEEMNAAVERDQSFKPKPITEIYKDLSDV